MDAGGRMCKLYLGAAGWGGGLRETDEIWYGAWFGTPRTKWSQIWLIPSLFPAQLITLGGKSKDLELCTCLLFHYFTCQQRLHPLIYRHCPVRACQAPKWWVQSTGKYGWEEHINHTCFCPGKGHACISLSIIDFQWDNTVYWSSVTKVQVLWCGGTRWDGRPCSEAERAMTSHDLILSLRFSIHRGGIAKRLNFLVCKTVGWS